MSNKVTIDMDQELYDAVEMLSDKMNESVEDVTFKLVEMGLASCVEEGAKLLYGDAKNGKKVH